MEEFVPAVRDFSTTSCWGSLVWTPRWEFIWTRAPTEACSSVKELDTKALGNQKPVGANCVTRKTVHPACSRHTWQCSRCWNKSLSSPEAGEVQGWDRRNLRRGIPWNGWVEDPCQARRCWRSTATERAESSDYAGNDAANQGWWRNAVVEPWRQKVRVDLRRCVRNQRDADHRNDVVADVERHQCSKEMDQKPESWSWGWQIPVDKGARPKARESRPREKWGEDVSCEFQQWGHSYNKTSKRRHQDVSCRFQQWDDNNSKTSRRRQNSQSKEWEKPIRVWEKSRERNLLRRQMLPARREQSTKVLQIRSWRVCAHELPVLRIEEQSPVQLLRVCAYCHDEQVHSAMSSTKREGREAHMRAGRSTDLAGENASGSEVVTSWRAWMYRQAKSPASFPLRGVQSFMV